MLVRATNYSFAHGTAGAARIRHSLRPLFSRGRENYLQSSGASRREIAEVCSSVILRCEPCGALAPLGEPRRMNRPPIGPPSFEARRRGSHLQMTVRESDTRHVDDMT